MGFFKKLFGLEEDNDGGEVQQAPSAQPQVEPQESAAPSEDGTQNGSSEDNNFSSN